MEPKKTVACTCEKCGNEAEMTIKCEEVIPAGGTPSRQQQRRTVVCSRCGNEAEMIVDYADS
jgi:hypothetical protein